eukprot:5995270-Lingulodinium_polyedra.AAC.1
MGCVAVPDGRMGPEVRFRVGSASSAFNKYRGGVFASHQLTVNVKKQLPLVHSKLLHAAESWVDVEPGPLAPIVPFRVRVLRCI